MSQSIRSRKSVEALEASLGYRFRDPELLAEALTHKSYRNEHPEEPCGDNERLEFLGDAVLDLVVSQHLFKVLTHLPEGELTRLRAEVVSEPGLARLGRVLGIGDALRLGRGEERTGGRRKDSLLANGVEAIFGALFTEAGFEEARERILGLIVEEIRCAVERERALDTKSMLQELLQSRCGMPPSYRLVRTEGPDHARIYTMEVLLGDKVLGEGRGRSKKLAQQQAAQSALEALADR